MIPLYEIFRKGKSIETESRFVVTGTWWWEQRVTADGHKGPFGNDGNVLKLDCGNGCLTLYIYCKLLNYILKMNELYDM